MLNLMISYNPPFLIKYKKTEHSIQIFGIHQIYFGINDIFIKISLTPHRQLEFIFLSSNDRF